jgi:hypothetical protein
VTLRYRFEITCPACAGPLDHREGTEEHEVCFSSVEVWCSECMVIFQVVAEVYALRSMPPAGNREEALRRRAGENLDGVAPAVFR